jgi:hypothetical protein
MTQYDVAEEHNVYSDHLSHVTDTSVITGTVCNVRKVLFNANEKLVNAMQADRDIRTKFEITHVHSVTQPSLESLFRRIFDMCQHDEATA